MADDSFFCIALRPKIVKRAMLLALVVGGILIAINHGPCITSGMFNFTCLWQSVLTFFVPYAVSTVSSVMAINEQRKNEK